MPWLNKPQGVLSSSPRALNCEYQYYYTSCRVKETKSVGPLKQFPRANQLGKKVKRVAFSDRIDVNEISPTGSLYSSAANGIWWSQEDYSKMLLITKLARDNDRSSEVCMVGLEACSGSEYQKRKERKIRVISAVLTAQKNQKLEGITDPVYIAALSRSFTSASVEEAYLRASDGTAIELLRVEENITDQDLVEIRI
ncbi:unnamed protein product [Cylindrotheca closterium]|uniref:Uncharacterized protein n=1 Tax=Cylindrotheca closterium TaxID=2856 RepID=A0AAD2FZZ1_9STRA|nr:unnamed protein product [Cylindrotheca closterium]